MDSLYETIKTDNVNLLSTQLLHVDARVSDNVVTLFKWALECDAMKIITAMLSNQIANCNIFRYGLETILRNIKDVQTTVDLSIILNYYAASECYGIKYDIVVDLVRYHPGIVIELLGKNCYHPNRVTKRGLSILSMSIICKQKILTDLLLSMEDVDINLCKYSPDGKLLSTLIFEYGWLDTYDKFTYLM